MDNRNWWATIPHSQCWLLTRISSSEAHSLQPWPPSPFRACLNILRHMLYPVSAHPKTNSSTDPSPNCKTRFCKCFHNLNHRCNSSFSFFPFFTPFFNHSIQLWTFFNCSLIEMKGKNEIVKDYFYYICLVN